MKQSVRQQSQNGPTDDPGTTTLPAASAAAPAVLVNRTHRVIRQRAIALQTRKRTIRSLLIPLGVSITLLAALAVALWSAFEDYEATPTGLPDSSQMLVVLMWSVPLTAMVLAVVWFRRSLVEREGGR